MKKITVAATLAALFSASGAWATPTVEQQIEVLMQEIEALKAQVAKSDQDNRGSGVQSPADRTTIGGYGELHYNNFRDGATDKDVIDFHRFVLFFGHRFNDVVSFKSEFELEHAFTKGSGNGGNGSGGGEVELEQAYLDFNIHKNFNAKAGVFLIPMGILNETHEPPTFHGVERNEVETRVIPSTWWESGVGAYGEIVPGLNYQLNVTSGPDIGKLSNFSKGFRDSRTKANEAVAEDWAVSGSLNYTGTPGLLVGAAFFTGNTGQDGKTKAALADVDARLTLWDVHARYQKDRIDLRALYAHGHLSDAAQINAALGKAAGSTTGVGESFYGWYAEAAYHVWKHGEHDLAPFVRYEKWDLHDAVPTGYVKNITYNNSIWTVGANYWPHPQVVLKGDYQIFDKTDGSKGEKRMNMGLGYMF